VSTAFAGGAFINDPRRFSVSRFTFVPSALALALLFSSNARCASDAELADIRDEIRSLKSSYEARIQALEQRLKEAEASMAQAAAAPVAPASTGTSASSLSAFNPAISAVLDGTYANFSKDPNKSAIAGFAPSGAQGPGRRGFGLGESELVFSSNVDPHFAANLILSITPENTISVEEAYGLYLTAPFGLAPKFGRFFSGLGYLNEQHAHAWDFVDAPLVYQAFLGGQYATDGVQVKWVAPIDQFFEVGVEAGNGDGFPGGPRNKNGAGSGAVFAHTGGDVGVSNNWRAGLSYLGTRSDEPDASGKSRISIADFVWKYAPNGNPRQTNFKVQGEYFTGKIRDASTQSGWYLQGVYQFMPEWRLGARYDRLDPRGQDLSIDAPLAESAGFKPQRYSVMLDFNPSEFSRIRLQFAQARLAPEITDNQWFIQYILSLGAHGAHKY
jgi:hypothetical protein